METALLIAPTPTTPQIKFDPMQGRLEINGRSISDNSFKFYKPLLDSIDKYIVKPVSPTIIDIRFDYMNTVSLKCILDMLKRMEGLPQRGVKVMVNWHYTGEDDFMKQAGMDYKAILKLDINILKI